MKPFKGAVDGCSSQAAIALDVPRNINDIAEILSQFEE